MNTPDFDHMSFLATATRGTEGGVAGELEELGANDVRVVPGGVTFRGTIDDGMRACMWSRLAGRVLTEVGRDRISSDRQLYPSVRGLRWSAWLHPDRTLAVHARASGHVIRDTRWAALKIKDALVDACRDGTGRRPDIERRTPDIEVVAHFADRDVRYYVDLSGAPLHHRGYRVREVDAPLRETLAAALLRFAGYGAARPLHDPTCGSGTIAIEAAWMATDRAPGLGRRFGFERWPTFDAHLASRWAAHADEAQQRKRPLRAAIIASDKDPSSVVATRANLTAAGVEGVVVKEADATRDMEPLLGEGLFVFNPPWGERIGGGDAGAIALHEAIGAHLADAAPGHELAVLTTPQGADALGAAWARTQPVRHGKLDCVLAVGWLPE